MSSTLLRIQDLRTYYMTPAGAVKGADGVTLTVNQGERFGMVGAGLFLLPAPTVNFLRLNRTRVLCQIVQKS